MDEIIPGEFRLLITGSRNWVDYRRIWAALNKIDEKLGPRPAVLIHGGAKGVDTIASEHWLRALGENSALNIGPRRTELFLPSWRNRGTYDPTAGHKRNQKMVDAGANLCLAFIHDYSRGATDCVTRAEKAGIRTVILREKP